MIKSDGIDLILSLKSRLLDKAILMEGIVCAPNGLRDVVAKFLAPRELYPSIEVP